MKKFFLTLLVLLVIIGALAGAGFWGYRIGYANGATGSDNGQFFAHPYNMDPGQMPFHGFDRGANRGFGRGFDSNPHAMMQPGGYHGIGMGRGYFSPLHTLWYLVVLALVIWFVYWLFNKSGWQITRKTNAAAEATSADQDG